LGTLNADLPDFAKAFCRICIRFPALSDCISLFFEDNAVPISTQPKAPGAHSPSAELGLLETSSRPAFLWAENSAHLLWANDAAASFTSQASVDALLKVPFAGTPFAAQMDAARRSLRPGIQRLELLRMPGKNGTVSFIGRMTLMIANQETTLLVIGPETKTTPSKALEKIKPQEKTAQDFSSIYKETAISPLEKAKGKKAKKQKQKPVSETTAPLVVAKKAVAPRHLEPHERENLEEIARALADVQKGIPIETTVAPDDSHKKIDALQKQNHNLQNELHEARILAAELQAILDTATDGVLILDADARILNMNRPAEALFGHDLSAVTGESLLHLLDPSSHETAHAYLQKILFDTTARALNDGCEVLGLEKHGGQIPLFMTVGWLGDSDGRSTFCAVLRDITQWKLVETDLIRSRKRAESASEQKSDFLAKMSHEIRTPLNAIIGFSEVMLEERFGPVGNERYKQYLKDIHASGGFLLSLVNDLLDLSKIEAGKLDLSFAPVSLNELALQTIALLQPRANAKGLILRSSLQPVARVVADARSIRQILLNLLSNAIRFTPEGGQVIISTLWDEDGGVSLRVRDTGIGMTEFEIALAIEPFRQIKTEQETGNNGGTGLGLPISKALAEANHARFDIVSEPKKGTLISVTFPQNRLLA
jgi:PAS domain S-box-containing protein